MSSKLSFSLPPEADEDEDDNEVPANTKTHTDPMLKDYCQDPFFQTATVTTLDN